MKPKADRFKAGDPCLAADPGFHARHLPGTVIDDLGKSYLIQREGEEPRRFPDKKVKPAHIAKRISLAPPETPRINTEVWASTAQPREMIVQPKPQEPARSVPYMRWVKRHDCMHCGAFMPSDSDHYGDRGMGQKCSDFLTVALCRKCHDARTATNCLPGRTRAETHQIMLGAQAVLIQESLELLPLEVRVEALARALEGVDTAVLNAALK
jgi:hypothetical protein